MQKRLSTKGPTQVNPGGVQSAKFKKKKLKPKSYFGKSFLYSFGPIVLLGLFRWLPFSGRLWC